MGRGLGAFLGTAVLGLLNLLLGFIRGHSRRARYGMCRLHGALGYLAPGFLGKDAGLFTKTAQKAALFAIPVPLAFGTAARLKTDRTPAEPAIPGLGDLRAAVFAKKRTLQVLSAAVFTLHGQRPPFRMVEAQAYTEYMIVSDDQRLHLRLHCTAKLHVFQRWVRARPENRRTGPGTAPGGASIPNTCARRESG